MPLATCEIRLVFVSNLYNPLSDPIHNVLFSINNALTSAGNFTFSERYRSVLVL